MNESKPESIWISVSPVATFLPTDDDGLGKEGT
jgi:hypothetical protein